MGTATQASPVSPATEDDLAEHLRILAVHGAIKGKRANDAKAALPEGFEGSAEVMAHIKTKISKGVTLIGDPTTRSPSVHLFTLGIVAALLARFKVTATKLRTALRKIAAEAKGRGNGENVGFDLVKENPELQIVFDQVSKEIEADLPRVHVPGTQRSPAVYVTPLDVDIRGA